MTSQKEALTATAGVYPPIYPLIVRLKSERPERSKNFATTFQAIIQKIFLKGFLITFREIFLQGFGNIFYIFSVIKKPIRETFLKSFRIISRNPSLEKVCEKHFGKAL